MQAPVMVMNTNTKRESGRQTQLANIQAAKVHKFAEILVILTFAPHIQYLGSSWYRDIHFGPSVHVEDAPGPNGRHCDD